MKRIPPTVRLLILLVVISVPLLLAAPWLPGHLAYYLAGGWAGLVAVLIAVRWTIEGRERRRGRKLDREIAEQAAGPSRRELADKEREYRQKWLDGIQKLQRARISLYQLPWYLLLGEPGGGKTMTLLNSGMDFPMGKEELPGFGGTRNYNWWFTNTAVILDTAGRLVFDQEGTSDRHEWEAFLKMLRRRRRCPINGVVLTLPADKLMNDSPEQRDENAGILRDRLRQIQNTLGVRFPVFLLITKADLIAGFTEFFNHLDSLQRNQLFGWSRPGDFDTPYEPQEFSREFDQLHERLHELRLGFLNRPASDVEVGWIYTFPEAFRIVKDRIQDYVNVIFSANIFAEPLFFRGFYFTSALQEGKPIIDVLGEHLSGEDLENLEGLFPQSRAFFIHDFYTRKVAREQGMVFQSQRHIRRMRFLRNSTLFVGVPAFVIMMALAGLGYFTYQRTAEQPRQAIAAAIELIEPYRAARESGALWTVDDAGQARAIEVSKQLDQAVADVQNPSPLARAVFSSIGTDAASRIRAVQRELLGYCVARPEIARVEAALAGPEPALDRNNIAAFAASLNTYAGWCFGRQEGDLATARSILPDPQPRDPAAAAALARFLDPQAGGRMAQAIGTDAVHQRRILDAAIDRAGAYWRSTADLEHHPDYAWWSRLVALCDQTRESYGVLLELYREFDASRDPSRFKDAAEKWLSTIPAPSASLAASGAAPARDARLLQAIREHLHDAPVTGGQLVLLKALVDQNAARAAAFWKDFLSVAGAARGPLQAYAEQLPGRIADLQQEVQHLLQSGKKRMQDRIDQLEEDLLQPYPRVAPQEYQFQADAEEVERILRTDITPLLEQAAVRIDPALDDWRRRIRDLVSRSEHNVEYQVSDPWQPRQLARLASAVRAAHRRYEAQAVVDEIAQQLDEAMPPQGLARFRFGEDDEPRAVQQRFAGLKSRHDGAFLIGTLQSKQDLQQQIREAARAGLLADADALEALLDKGMRIYVEHYLGAWSDAYTRQRLELLDGEFEVQRPEDWNNYRLWIRRHAKSLREDYEARLTALSKEAIEPFYPRDRSGDEVHAQLAELAEGVEWPPDSRLEPLFKAAAQGTKPPDVRAALRGWQRFEQQVDDLRLERLGELTQPPLFPKLAEDAPGLAGEWLTRQMQYVIDYGEWLFWREVLQMLRREHLDPLPSLPFIFDGGSFAGTDGLRLQALLRDLAHLRELAAARQTAGGAAPGPELLQWLERAAAWSAFLQGRPVDLRVGCDGGAGAAAAAGALQKYYAQIVLRTPGLSTADGRPQGEIVFASGRASAPQPYRWAPEKGLTFVVLREPSAEASGRGAALQPRILELPESEYGLLELLMQHGAPGPSGRGTWSIEISKDLSTLPGLGAVAEPDAMQRVALKVEFPQAPLPEALPPPDPRALTGPRPQPPWQGD